MILLALARTNVIPYILPVNHVQIQTIAMLDIVGVLMPVFLSVHVQLVLKVMGVK